MAKDTTLIAVIKPNIQKTVRGRPDKTDCMQQHNWTLGDIILGCPKFSFMYESMG